MSREPGTPERDRDDGPDNDHGLDPAHLPPAGRDPGHLPPAALDPPPLDQADEALVRSVLARHADVGPMPSHVAERLALALAAAQDAEDAAADTADTADTAESASAAAVHTLRRGVHPAAERRRLAHPVRLLVAAAVGVTVLASGISLTYLDGGTEGAATNTAGAAPRSEAESGAGTGADADADAEAEAPAAAAEPDAAGPGWPGIAAGSGGPPSVTTSGRDYTADSLPSVASSLLSPRDQPSASEPTAQSDRAVRPAGPLAPPPAAELDRLRDAVALGLCARALSDGASGQVLAADLGRYRGQPAAVLVLPGPDPTVVDVWVVGPGCAPGDEQVLARERVPR